MQTMYRGMPNSPATKLTQDINSAADIVPVQDVSAFPPAPNLAVIGTDETAETILYTAKTESALSGCTRGVEGLARTWTSGTPIARNFTAYDYNTLMENVTANDTAVTAVTTSDAQKAPIESPTFTGTPKAPTAAQGTNTTQIATTAFVNNANSAVLSKCLQKTGGTMSGPITLSGAPTSDLHAATKKYVDDKFGSIVNGNEVGY